MRGHSLPTAPTTIVGIGTRARPVLLATLGVPFDEAATCFAVDAAVESGVALLVINAVQLQPLPLSLVLGYDQAADPPELLDDLAAPARLAAALGVEVERIRVRSPRPVEALLELVSERTPGLLVFGPDRSTVSRRSYAKAVRRIRESARCLVWLAEGS